MTSSRKIWYRKYIITSTRCSGNRSKQAAEKLAALGYSNVYEFGGIIDWSGETISGS